MWVRFDQGADLSYGFFVALAEVREDRGRGLVACGRARLAQAAMLLCAWGCGGTIGGPDGSGGTEPDGSGSFGTGGQADDSGGTGGLGSGGRLGSGGSGSGGEPYIEPECPDEPPPPIEPECDPMAAETGCYEGYGCYPYLVYPNGEDCGFAVVNAVCVFAGTEGQGEICGMGSYCKPGFMCVIGGTAGARCAQICSPAESGGCPHGLVCNETDVTGYGVCF